MVTIDDKLEKLGLDVLTLGSYHQDLPFSLPNSVYSASQLHSGWRKIESKPSVIRLTSTCLMVILTSSDNLGTSSTSPPSIIWLSQVDPSQLTQTFTSIT